MSKKTITPEQRSATLSVRAKIRKAIGVAGAVISKADSKKLDQVLASLEKTLAPDAKPAQAA